MFRRDGSSKEEEDSFINEFVDELFKPESGHFPESIELPYPLESIRLEETCCRPKLIESATNESPSTAFPSALPTDKPRPLDVDEALPRTPLLPVLTRAPLPTTPKPSFVLEDAAAEDVAGSPTTPELQFWRWPASSLSLETCLCCCCCCLATATTAAAALLSKFWLALLLFGRLLWLAGEIPVSVNEDGAASEDDERSTPSGAEDILTLE